MPRDPLLALVALVTLVLLACSERPPPPGDAVAPTPTATPSAAATPATTASAQPTPTTAIAAQHVLIAWKGAKGAPKSVNRTKAEAKKRAEEVVTRARGGADFSALVAEYSEDPGSKERQGSLGKFTREKMTPPFSEAAFALQIDQVSDVVETEFGFHVIKRNQ